MEKRPILNKNISVTDFKEFYWLKKELSEFCKREGLKISGDKTEINKRIEFYLKTGEKRIGNNLNTKAKTKSKFDWKKEKLSLKTQITDNYRNTENTREFFKQEIGNSFKFNVKFMNWMKSNSGKTLGDATKEWDKIKQQIKNNIKPKKIAPQFEYNTYLRDFLDDNKNSTRELGIRLWKIKKTMRGDNTYRKEDLKLVDEK